MKKILLIPLMMLTACSLFFEKPKANLKDARIAALDADGLTINFLLAVDNRNSYDITLHEYRYDLRLMALPLVHGKSTNPLTFRGNSGTDFLIPARLRYSDISEILKRRPGLEEIPYQFDAELVIETSLGNIHVPVNKSGALTLPEQYRPKSLLRKLGTILENSVRK